MPNEHQPYYPDDLPPANPGDIIRECKYMYALRSIIFYSIHVGDETLTYYKEDRNPITLDPSAPGILRWLQGECETLDFHERYWYLRNWVAEHKRKNPGEDVEFREQTYEALDNDMDVEDEVDEILNKGNNT